MRPLGPSETAKCFVTMGADDLATLTVDQKEIMNLGPRGPEGGGTYDPGFHAEAVTERRSI